MQGTTDTPMTDVVTKPLLCGLQHPTQIAARHDMHMQMRHFLNSVFARIRKQAIPRAAYARLQDAPLVGPVLEAWRARVDEAALDDVEALAELLVPAAREADDAPALLIAHEPDIFPRVPDQVRLTVSGHTHGGQVRFLGRSPVLRMVWCEVFSYGHYVSNDQHLIVSGGIGCSEYPVRMGMPPELTLVTVRRA